MPARSTDAAGTGNDSARLSVRTGKKAGYDSWKCCADFSGWFAIFAGMKRFLEILLLLALGFCCAEAVGKGVAPLQEEQTACAGEIRETGGASKGDARLQDCCGLGGCYEYSAPGVLPQTARTRSGGGMRRTVTSFKNVFVKDSGLVNAANPIGFVCESSSYTSGTLSADSHFIILRKFRI